MSQRTASAKSPIKSVKTAETVARKRMPLAANYRRRRRRPFNEDQTMSAVV